MLIAGIAILSLLAWRALSWSGAASVSDLVCVLAIGVVLPLVAVGFGARHRRSATVVLAFAVGLCVNVVYLANGAPANAASDNTSDFYLYGPNSSACGNSPMGQTNADTGPASYPGGAGVNYFWCSDTFTSSQSVSAGTIQANVSLTNTSGTKDCLNYGELFWWHAATSTSTSIG